MLVVIVVIVGILSAVLGETVATMIAEGPHNAAGPIVVVAQALISTLFLSRHIISSY
jgi:hypothetical protein